MFVWGSKLGAERSYRETCARGYAVGGGTICKHTINPKPYKNAQGLHKVRRGCLWNSFVFMNTRVARSWTTLHFGVKPHGP